MNIFQWNQHQTTIGHLKVRYTGAQEDISKTVLRLRMERLLGNTDLHSPGLSTGAVLIVRKLDSPAPADVSQLSQSIQGNWNTFLRSQVAALYAAAARPALGAIPLDAASVLFADPGEMLTCLTHDLLNGQTEGRWYWQQVLRNVPRTPGTALTVLWCEQAPYVPTVLASLRPAEVFHALTHLTPLAVKQVIRSLHESFDLPADVLTAITSSRPEGSSLADVMMGDSSAEKQRPAVSSAPTTNLPPWEQWLPSASLPALSPEAHYLLGLGLTLHHAPAFARSSRFAAKAIHWLRTEREKRSYRPDRVRSLPEERSAPDIREQKMALAVQDDTDLQVAPSSKEEERVDAGGNDIDASHASEQQAVLGEQPLLAHDSDKSLAATEVQPSSSSAVLDERSGEFVISPLQPLSQVTQAPLPEALAEGLREQHADLASEVAQAPLQEALAEGAKEQYVDLSQGTEALRQQALAEGAKEQHIDLVSQGTEAPRQQALAEGAKEQHTDLLSEVAQAPRQQALPASSPQAVQSPSSSAPSQAVAPDSSSATETRGLVVGTSKALPADGVSTRLGGVLYLINLLLGLNLPHSWDSDGAFAEHMSGWAIVEALARGLLGDLHEQYVDDPIWQALALLDGREPGTPIAGSDMPVQDKPFRLPTSWLRRYGPAAWSAFSDDERLLLYDDAAGFLIADVPLRNRSFFEVAHAEVEGYCDQGLEVNWHLGFPEDFQKFSGGRGPMDAEGRLAAYLDEGALWWLGRVLGFVRYLLVRGLGEPLDEAGGLAEQVLCRHGQLIVSRTHVDLHMSMEEISIPVRRAGLDRNPGWVPDLAHIVYFHFD